MNKKSAKSVYGLYSYNNVYYDTHMALWKKKKCARLYIDIHMIAIAHISL
jgi:hypothetical protein